MNFSEALIEIKNGQKLTRTIWGNEKMFVEMHKKPYIVENEIDRVMTSGEFLQIRRPNRLYEPWIPSHSDILGNDWKVCSI